MLVRDSEGLVEWGGFLNDDEVTKSCAEAMGWTSRFVDYDPLHDDAQCMALVKKFNINICWHEINIPSNFQPTIYMWLRDDLNRAICECVADMQVTK